MRLHEVFVADGERSDLGPYQVEPSLQSNRGSLGTDLHASWAALFYAGRRVPYLDLTVKKGTSLP